MNILEQITSKIIKDQEQIMGPVAWYEASKISGLTVIDRKTGVLSLKSSDNRQAIDNLVDGYARLFGPAAQKTCRESAAALIADLQPGEVPLRLQ